MVKEFYCIKYSVWTTHPFLYFNKLNSSCQVPSEAGRRTEEVLPDANSPDMPWTASKRHILLPHLNSMDAHQVFSQSHMAVPLPCVFQGPIPVGVVDILAVYRT